MTSSELKEAGQRAGPPGPSLFGARRPVWFWPMAVTLFTASSLVVSADDLGADWFADEIWRANFVHSPHWWDLYLSWDTPTPPGFVMFFRIVGVVLPTGPVALRLTTIVTLVTAMALLLWLLLSIVDRAPSPTSVSFRSIRDWILRRRVATGGRDAERAMTGRPHDVRTPGRPARR